MKQDFESALRICNDYLECLAEIPKYLGPYIVLTHADDVYIASPIIYAFQDSVIKLEVCVSDPYSNLVSITRPESPLRPSEPVALSSSKVSPAP